MKKLISCCFKIKVNFKKPSKTRCNMTKKRFFLLLMLILFGWTQTNFAVEPTEQEILQILENLELKQSWFSISAKKAISGFCQNSNVSRLIDVSSQSKTIRQRWYLFALLRVLKRAKYWEYQGPEYIEINQVLYENQLILIQAFCQTLGLTILDNFENKDAVETFSKFMTKNLDQPQFTDCFSDNLIIISAQIFLFLDNKIRQLVEIIEMLVSDQIEAQQTIIAFYETIIKIGTDQEGELSFSARVANTHFKIFPPNPKHPQKKQGIKRKRPQCSQKIS